LNIGNLDLKFNTDGKEVNITLVSNLRCIIANLTDPSLFDKILMTAWEERNGTFYFVDPQHPLNGASNCSDVLPELGFRRRLQMINNQWIYPIDPISVNISAVPRPDDVNYTFIDDLYNSDELKNVAEISAIQEQRDTGDVPLPPSPSPTCKYDR